MKNLEEREQVAAISALGHIGERHGDPRFGWLHHSPNGGARSVVTGARMKAMGTRKGFPDLILPIPAGAGRFRGLAIEMKAGKGTTTPEQRAWLEAFHQWSWHVEVCRSAGAVVRAVMAHLGYIHTDSEAIWLENLVLMAGGTWSDQ